MSALPVVTRGIVGSLRSTGDIVDMQCFGDMILEFWSNISYCRSNGFTSVSLGECVIVKKRNN